MTQLLVGSVLELLIVLPIALLFRQRSGKVNHLLLLAALFFLVNKVLLALPGHYPALNVIESRWNWTGKALAILGSIGFYSLFKPHFSRNDFLTMRQQPASVRGNALVIGVLIPFTGLINFWLGSPKPICVETLAFQLTMPGLEEELAFRGVLLGLLTTALVSPITYGRWIIGHPALWITALLFGLVHGFSIGSDWTFAMNWSYLGSSFAHGWLLGWMTLRSRSILASIIMHNLYNVSLMLSVMLK